jgi:hypothetical protein
MTDDWQWFWAGEGGRDRILRDEVEGLHAQLSSASSQTHRLSSQRTLSRNAPQSAAASLPGKSRSG